MEGSEVGARCDSGLTVAPAGDGAMSARVFNLASVAVLLGCVGLLGHAGWSVVSQPPLPGVSSQADAPVQAVGAPPSAGVAPSRDLNRHLPLEGMQGSRTPDPDACRRLEGFVVDAVHELRERGQKPPFAPELLKTAIDSSRCRVTDVEVDKILSQLGAAYAQAGLEVVPPMSTGD